MTKFSLILFTLLFIGFNSIAQIEDIKNKANENKSNKNNNSNNSNNNNSDIGGDIADGCTEGCMEACFDVGCQVMMGFVAEYTAELFETKSVDPSILSLDINANFALAYYKGVDKGYKYVNYLPGIRANLVSFILDFKLNVLTEHTDSLPDSFKSWHLNLGFNIVPVETFKLALGTGVHYEQFTNSYFQEYFLFSKIGLSENTDYISVEMRASVDYETEEFPFFETGVFYNKKFIDFGNLYGYISLGTMYQNYYSIKDFWGFRGGVTFNWH